MPLLCTESVKKSRGLGYKSTIRGFIGMIKARSDGGCEGSKQAEMGCVPQNIGWMQGGEGLQSDIGDLR